MSRQRRASTVGGAHENGVRGSNTRSERKPDRGNAGRGGGRRNRRETALDENRKKMADTYWYRLARHQAD